MKSQLPKLLLLLVFLAGQWAYAEHDAATIGSGHSHSVDCPVCLTETPVAGASSLSDFYLDYSPPLQIGTAANTRCADFPRNQGIRAPPVH